MDEFLNWIRANWLEILAAFGLGGAGGAAGKKYIDKSQDKKINQLNEDMAKINERVRVVEAGISQVTQGLRENAIKDDSNYRKQDERYQDLKATLMEIKQQQSELMNKIFNLVSSK